MTILITVVFLTIFIIAFASLLEAVLYSTRLGTLEVAANTASSSSWPKSSSR